MKTLAYNGTGEYGQDLAKIATAVRTRTHKNAVTGAQAACSAQAKTYNARIPSNRALESQLDGVEKTALLHCWKGRSKPVMAIRRRIWSWLPPRHQGRCPYCALTFTPSTIDHFCEKSTLPELCLYDRNLIPSCPECNSDRATTFAEDGQHVIHFYDDDVDGIPDVLVAQLAEQNGIVVAEFDIRQPIPNGASLYARHFRALKLKSRYRLWAATVMRDFIDEHLCVSAPERWPQVLLNLANRWHVRWGNNEPKVALARGLAARVDLAQKLVTS